MTELPHYLRVMPASVIVFILQQEEIIRILRLSTTNTCVYQDRDMGFSGIGLSSSPLSGREEED